MFLVMNWRGVCWVHSSLDSILMTTVWTILLLPCYQHCHVSAKPYKNRPLRSEEYENMPTVSIASYSTPSITYLSFITENNVKLTSVLRFIDRSTAVHPPSCSFNRYLYVDYAIEANHIQRLYKEQMRKAVGVTRILNSLFLYTAPRLENSKYNNVTYFALAHSLVQNDPKIMGCAIAFQSNQYGSKLQNRRSFFPYAYRHKSTGIIVVTDLANFYEPFNTPWFHNQSQRNPKRYAIPVHTFFSNNSDVGDLSRIDVRLSQAVRVSGEDGFWAKPYYDCLLGAWILQYSLPFFETFPNASIVFKGVVLLDIDLTTMDINQCSTTEEHAGHFSGTHKCRQKSTDCVHTPGQGLRMGSYECRCKPSFYFQDRNAINRSFSGLDVELAFWDMLENRSSSYINDFTCLPCGNGCKSCDGDHPCIAEFNVLLRGIPLGVQSFCMTISFVVGIVIIRLRKTKVMQISVWILLEIMLLGGLLLYATVLVQYFEPTTMSCFLVPWFREVGFAFLYGTLVLKMYRILAEFRSHKAHRVHVRDKDLIKCLVVILVVVIWYMVTWTALNIDQLHNGTKLINTYVTGDLLEYVLCNSLWWDYVIEIAEICFLGVGIYLSYRVRAAPSAYEEGRYLTIAISHEFFISSLFYIVKHIWWRSMHPDYLFLMHFLRCQATITVNLFVLLGPKLWFAHRPLDDDRIRSRAYSQPDFQENSAVEIMKLNVGISSNGDVDIGEMSIAEMDPEDIRTELKRLYAQLQIYRTKAMRKDNPHISRRRGGRKQTHRRFSLQAFHHKHRHQHRDRDRDNEISRTPEESTNSADAMPIAMDGNLREDSNEGSFQTASCSGGRTTDSVSALPAVGFSPGNIPSSVRSGGGGVGLLGSSDAEGNECCNNPSVTFKTLTT